MKATRRLIACILAFAVVISVNLGIAFAAPQAQESTNKLQEAEGADVILYVSADGSDQDGDGTFEKRKMRRRASRFQSARENTIWNSRLCSSRRTAA